MELVKGLLALIFLLFVLQGVWLVRDYEKYVYPYVSSCLTAENEFGHPEEPWYCHWR